MTVTLALAERLLATAAGSWQREAATWLLIEHGHWLPELSRHGLIDEDGYSDEFAAIDWEEAGCRAESDQLIGTGSELQVLFIACALATTGSTPLFNLSSLDDTNKLLALHAMAWAMGGHAYADKTVGVPGLRCARCGLRLTGMDGKTAITHMRTHETPAA